MVMIISRILRTAYGRVLIQGSHAPLIELGAGFHAELNGRENDYFNDSILGFSDAQIDENFKRIFDFTELWDFVDVSIRK